MTTDPNADVALAITASSSEMSVALRSADGSIRASRPDDAEGASDLAAVVARVFDQNDTRASRLGEIRIDVGPGSYTGLRVAVTFARVTAHFRRIPVRTTTSLELMALAAWNSKAVPEDVAIRPVLDARRHRFHHAPVELTTHANLIREPRATDLRELRAAIRPGDTLLAAKPLHAKLAAELGECVLVEPSPFDAALLFDPRLATRETGVDELEPLYLMGSYADG